MDPSVLTTTQWIMVGALLGFVVGLVPLITGFIKKNLKFGALGFVASIIGGAGLGLLLAVPIAAVFTWLVIRGAKQTSAPSSDIQNNS